MTDSESGEALIGASITTGENTGTITSPSGKYSINVHAIPLGTFDSTYERTLPDRALQRVRPLPDENAVDESTRAPHTRARAQ